MKIYILLIVLQVLLYVSPSKGELTDYQDKHSIQDLFFQYVKLNREQLEFYLKSLAKDISFIDSRRDCLEKRFSVIANNHSSPVNAAVFNDKLKPQLFDSIDKCIYTLPTKVAPTTFSSYEKDSKKKWLYTIISVAIISVAGLLCISIIPLLNTFCFSYLSQFLVALAVGCLSGDALLHLIPHTFLAHGHNDKSSSCGSLMPQYDGVAHDNGNSHDSAIYKGLSALAGIFVFFLMEKVVQLHRSGKEKKHKLNKNINPSRKFKTASGDEKVKKRTSDITNRGNSHHLAFPPPQPPCLSSSSYIITTTKIPCDTNTNSSSGKKHNDAKHKATQHLTNKACVENLTRNSEQQHLHRHYAHKATKQPIITKVNHHRHQRDAHVVWMVLAGDALHNFADGLVIGASFASSIPLGLGTTVAVFCHELPHELGAFAVLHGAGVSLRRALMFNAVSRVACFVGGLAGLLASRSETLTNCMSMVIAGIFLYISLVNMIPELGSNKNDYKLQDLFIQSAGIIIGIGIMILISIFEKNIVTIVC